MRKWLRPPQAVPGISGVSGSGVGDQNPAPVQHVTVVKAATDEQAAGSEEEPLVRLSELSDPPGPSPIPRRLTLPEIPEIPQTSLGPGPGGSGISGISGKAIRLKTAPRPKLRCRHLRTPAPPAPGPPGRVQETGCRRRPAMAPRGRAVGQGLAGLRRQTRRHRRVGSWAAESSSLGARFRRLRHRVAV